MTIYNQLYVLLLIIFIMKKSLWMLGLAVAAMTSCTNEEVMEVAQNRTIGFNAFVNNNTKAITEVTNLTGFYVFGEFGDAAGTYGTQVFKNEANTAIHYWQASKYYSFGAYANGDNTKIDNATFDAETGTLTFPEYTPNVAIDLVAAVKKLQSNSDVTANEAVALTFGHMLSQVKFTFKTTDADAYLLKITELKVEGAVSKATGTYNGTASWVGSESNGYTYAEIPDVAMAENDYTASVDRLVIPQASTDKLKVTFKATVSGSGMEEKTATFTADLGYTAGEVAGTTDNTWTPGYRYNYIATINADQIDPSLENQKIEFTTSVTGWEDAADTDKGELSKN